LFSVDLNVVAHVPPFGTKKDAWLSQFTVPCAFTLLLDY